MVCIEMDYEHQIAKRGRRFGLVWLVGFLAFSSTTRLYNVKKKL